MFSTILKKSASHWNEYRGDIKLIAILTYFGINHQQDRYENNFMDTPRTCLGRVEMNSDGIDEIVDKRHTTDW